MWALTAFSALFLSWIPVLQTYRHNPEYLCKPKLLSMVYLWFRQYDESYTLYNYETVIIHV